MSSKAQFQNSSRNQTWRAEWRVGLMLALIIMAFLAAPGAKAWDPNHPIVGSIADDLIAIGDRQYGRTEYIVQRQDGYAFKTRHQRVSLDGAELFCSQAPGYSQYKILGIRINNYNEQSPVTICNLAEEPSYLGGYEELLQKQREAVAPEVRSTIEDEWLIGAQLKTERSYCLGNVDSREFIEPAMGTWLAEGNVLNYQPGMFTGFEIAADQESRTLFVVSALLDREDAREMGCAPIPGRVVVKISVAPGQAVASHSEAP